MLKSRIFSVVAVAALLGSAACAADEPEVEDMEAVDPAIAPVVVPNPGATTDPAMMDPTMADTMGMMADTTTM